MYHRYVAALLQRVPPRRLHLWAASLYPSNVPPEMTEVALTEPLRAPPAVTQQVAQARGIGGDIRPYSAPPSPLATDGPAVRVVEHAGPGHQQGDPCGCLRCGQQVGEFIVQLVHSVINGMLTVFFYICREKKLFNDRLP